jgi:uncharacterized protein YndB with AHSA1/START domain
MNSFDVTAWLRGAQRRLEDGEREGRPTRIITASRSYDAPIDDVWDALTNPTRIPRWFMPVSGDLQLGGRYQLEGNAGGTISRCESPSALAVTWEYGGDVSWVEVQLSAAGPSSTFLELRHVSHVPDEFWDQYGPGAVGVGWDQAMLGLSMYLATGAALSPEEAQAWPFSDEGRAFIQQSSAGWGQAAIAAGSDATAAQAAAARTYAFYTGAGEQ